MSVSLWRKWVFLEKRCFYEHGSRSAGMHMHMSYAYAYVYAYVYVYVYLRVSENVWYSIHKMGSWIGKKDDAPLELGVAAYFQTHPYLEDIEGHGLWRNPILWMRCQTVKAEKMKSQGLSGLRKTQNPIGLLVEQSWKTAPTIWGFLKNGGVPKIHCFNTNMV